MADKRMAPLDVGNNDFNVRKFSGGTSGTETTHHADAVPENFKGKYVTLYATGGNVWFGFSTSASAEIDRTVAATNAGASAKVGAYLPSQYLLDWVVPDSPPGVPMYFVRESDAVGAVVNMTLSDDRKA